MARAAHVVLPDPGGPCNGKHLVVEAPREPNDGVLRILAVPDQRSSATVAAGRAAAEQRTRRAKIAVVLEAVVAGRIRRARARSGAARWSGAALPGSAGTVSWASGACPSSRRDTPVRLLSPCRPSLRRPDLRECRPRGSRAPARGTRTGTGSTAGLCRPRPRARGSRARCDPRAVPRVRPRPRGSTPTTRPCPRARATRAATRGDGGSLPAASRRRPRAARSARGRLAPQRRADRHRRSSSARAPSGATPVARSCARGRRVAPRANRADASSTRSPRGCTPR